MKQLIGKPLQEVEESLKKQNKDYFVTILLGGKDAELLQELYIVRAKEKESKLELMVTGFKTTM